MKYLAGTIVRYVAGESAGEGTFRFVLPSYPAPVLRAVGVELEETFSRVVGRRVAFQYAIAYRLGEKWRQSDSAADRAAFQLAREHGWYNEDDNLTSARNRVRDPNSEDTLVSVIAGYDHIDDRASLQDFFHLDDQAIWDMCLRHSFEGWVVDRFSDALDASDYTSAMEQIADALETIYDHGLAGLAGISAYLEKLDLGGVGTGREAYRLVLSGLRVFELPAMPGLARDGRARSLAAYLGPAQEFVNYGAFLEESARKKALKAIADYRSEDPPLPDEEVLGEFSSRDDLLESLSRYIEGASARDREKVLTADFVYIHDHVLGYKRRSGKKPPRKPSVRKLSGLPPEVFLRAIWLTLGDYCELVEAKQYCGIELTDNANDGFFTALITGASRYIDAKTNRRFYTTAEDETRYYQVIDERDGDVEVLWLRDELLSVTSLKTDEDGDGTYETTWTTSDYKLFPLNAVVSGRPFTWIETRPNSAHGFPVGVQAGIQIIGKFGYSTSAPAVVKSACLLQVSRWWNRKNAPFGVVGSADMGQAVVVPKLDPDIAEMLKGVTRE